MPITIPNLENQLFVKNPIPAENIATIIAAATAAQFNAATDTANNIIVATAVIGSGITKQSLGSAIGNASKGDIFQYISSTAGWSNRGNLTNLTNLSTFGTIIMAGTSTAFNGASDTANNIIIVSSSIASGITKQNLVRDSLTNIDFSTKGNIFQYIDSANGWANRGRLKEFSISKANSIITPTTGRTISKVEAKGLWLGITHDSDIAQNGSVALLEINGEFEDIAAGTWNIISTLDSGSPEIGDIDFTVVGKDPISPVFQTVKFFQNVGAKLRIYVQNYKGGGAIDGLLLGMNSKDMLNKGIISGIEINGTPDKLAGSPKKGEIVQRTSNSWVSRGYLTDLTNVDGLGTIIAAATAAQFNAATDANNNIIIVTAVIGSGITKTASGSAIGSAVKGSIYQYDSTSNNGWVNRGGLSNISGVVPDANLDIRVVTSETSSPTQNDIDVFSDGEKFQLILPNPKDASTPIKPPGQNYQVVSGTPPKIGTVTTRVKGDYAVLDFSEVSDAISYEWQFKGDDFWNVTNDQIDPGSVKIEHGNLEVTVRFDPILNARTYQYQIISGGSIVRDWITFNKIENNMVTVIISNLEEGTEYELNLRVGEPWISDYITLKFTAGRLIYVMNIINGGTSEIFLLNTGTTIAGSLIQVKRISLPTVINRPSGFAVHGDFAYIIQGGSNKGLYVINHATTTNGNLATIERKNNFNSNFNNLTIHGGMAYDKSNDNIYVYLSDIYLNHLAGLYIFSSNIVNGGTLVDLGSNPNLSTSTYFLNYGVSIQNQDLYCITTNTGDVVTVDKDSTLSNLVPSYIATSGFYRHNSDQIVQNDIDGLEVLGEDFFIIDDDIDNRISRHRINPDNNRLESQWYGIMPSGLTNARYLSIPD